METFSGREARFPGGLQEVAPGVHAWLRPNGDWGESNAALVVGDGESLLVDTLWTPALAREMLAAMAPITGGAPIRRVVNTHADGDHWWGNQEVAGPGIEIVATEVATEEMGEPTPQTLRMMLRAGRALSLATRVPLPVPGRSRAQAAGAFFESMLGPFDFAEVRMTPATRTFADRLELDAGGRRVELIAVGPAHTPGDAIVHVPDARAVLAADVLFVGVMPVMWIGPADNWIAALDRVLELEPEVVVPGHGPVTDRDGVRLLQEFFRFLEAAARRRFAAGDSPGSAALAIVGSEEFRSAPWGEWEAPERIVVALNALKRTAEGATAPPGPPERIRVLAELGRVRQELATAA